MPLNRDVESDFVLEPDTDYTIDIKIKGPDIAERHLLMMNMSFDLDGNEYEFFGSPVVESGSTSQRFVLVKVYK
jgi:hypothetical protein